MLQPPKKSSAFCLIYLKKMFANLRMMLTGYFVLVYLITEIMNCHKKFPYLSLNYHSLHKTFLKNDLSQIHNYNERENKIYKYYMLQITVLA